MNKKYENSDLVYNNFSFNKFNVSDEEFNELSGDTKYKHLQRFFNKMNKFRKVKSRTKDTTKRKVIVKDVGSELFNEQMRKLDGEYKKLWKVQKKEFHSRYNVDDLILEDFNFNDWLVPPLEGDEKVPLMPALEVDEEEVQGGKGIKILTPITLLTRLPVLLSQMKATNNLHKLKNKIRQVVYLLYQHNTTI